MNVFSFPVVSVLYSTDIDTTMGKEWSVAPHNPHCFLVESILPFYDFSRHKVLITSFEPERVHY